MTVRYVDGVNGNNSWDGLAPNFVSGSNGPKLTISGAEATPVVAGDLVWIRPGVYRELLTCGVSGSAGNPIIYSADLLGQIWGVGGMVRITGSDNDTTETRANCITGTTKNYRTFRGLSVDLSTTSKINNDGGTNWIVEDSLFQGTGNGFNVQGATQANCTMRHCVLMTGKSQNEGMFNVTHTATVDNAGHLIENCIFLGSATGVRISRVGGITVKHCLGIGNAQFAKVVTALTVGQTVTVNDCIMCHCVGGLAATATGEIVEDSNSFSNVGTARSNVNTGANSQTYHPLLRLLRLLSGFQIPQPVFGELSAYSPLRAIAGTGMSSDDLFGITRPATDSKKSWGPIQFVDESRDTANADTGSVDGKLADAGMMVLYDVFVTNVSTTISVRVKWEANYAGTKPQMVIRQAGQADQTVTAVGSGAYETLSITWTPAASPSVVQVFLVSNNTATSGSYATYADNFQVS